MAIRGINTQVEVQSTLGSALTVSAVTKANPAVATSTSHGLSNGDVVIFDTEGMVQIDGIAVRVANVTTDTFELEGVDSTAFGTFTSGTATEVTAWNTFASLQSIDLPNQEATRIDITTIHDTQRQETLGLPGSVTGTMSGLFSPSETAIVNIRNATRDTEPRAFRVTFETDQVGVFNADVSAGQGFSMSQNGVATSSYSLTIKKFISYYAS